MRKSALLRYAYFGQVIPGSCFLEVFKVCFTVVSSFIYCKLNGAKQQLYKNRNKSHVFSCHIHPRKSQQSCPDSMDDDSSNQHTKYVKKTVSLYWMWSRRVFGGSKHFAGMSQVQLSLSLSSLLG